jgi:hypothetical protein
MVWIEQHLSTATFTNSRRTLGVAFLAEAGAALAGVLDFGAAAACFAFGVGAIVHRRFSKESVGLTIKCGFKMFIALKQP